MEIIIIIEIHLITRIVKAIKALAVVIQTVRGIIMETTTIIVIKEEEIITKRRIILILEDQIATIITRMVALEAAIAIAAADQIIMTMDHTRNKKIEWNFKNI